jgi:hypothetical protein
LSSKLAGFRGPDASRPAASVVTSPPPGLPRPMPRSHTGLSRPLFTPDVRPNPHKPPTSPHVSREESAPDHDRCDHGAGGAHQPPGGAGRVGHKGRLRSTVCGRRGMRHRDGSERRTSTQGPRPRTGGRLRAGSTEPRAREAHTAQEAHDTGDASAAGAGHGGRRRRSCRAREAQAAELQSREAQGEWGAGGRVSMG